MKSVFTGRKQLILPKMSNPTTDANAGSPPKFNFASGIAGLKRGQPGQTGPKSPRGEAAPAAAARPTSPAPVGKKSDPRPPTVDTDSKMSAVQRGRSPPVAVARVPIASINESQPLDDALTIIRRTSSDKALPLVLSLLRMEEFYKKHTGRPSDHVSALLNNVLQAVSQGRKVEGEDATSHLDHLAKKLEGVDGNGALLTLRAFLVAEIRNPANAEVIKPYVQEGLGFKNENKPKSQFVTAEDLADGLLSKVTTHSIKRFFVIKHKYASPAMERILFDAIKTSAEATKASHPGFPAVCTYLLANQRMGLTEANAEQIITAALKPYYKSEKRQSYTEAGAPEFNADGTPKLKIAIFASVPANTELGRAFASVKWTDKKTNTEKSFTRANGNIEAMSWDRSHVINHFFPELAADVQRPATPIDAGIAVFCKIADSKKATA